MLYGHGNDIFSYDEIKYDMSSNVWYDGPPPQLLEYLKNSIYKISTYPQPDASDLIELLSTLNNVPPSSIIATNGSVEAFYLVAQAFYGSNSTILIPSFSEYEDACIANKHHVTYISNAAFSFQTPLDPGLFWFGNPNNPDGKVIPLDDIKKILKQNRSVIFVIDEAYCDLCYNFISSRELVSEFENLIIARSLTKAFSIPGLRLGYLLASEKITKKLNRLRQPWSVNALAIEAGKYICNHYNELKPDSCMIAKESEKLQASISEIPNFNVVKSDCPYFLVECRNITARSLKDYLALKHGILIRDASNFKGLSANHFRICTNSVTANQKLITGLKQYLEDETR